MKSFKIILIRNFIGMLFAMLSIVFLLFNVLTNNFISAEANRELLQSIANVEDAANRTAQGVFDVVLAPRQPQIMIMENALVQIRQMGSLRQLMMNTDGIIISEHNEIISPNILQMEIEIAAEIMFLARYFISNREAFDNNAMQRLASPHNTYYLMAIEYAIDDELSFSVLLHTDITSAILFMRNVNQTLGYLLLASGFLSVFMAILISSGVQKVILRLCKHAEVVGGGNFTQQVESFEYKEFNDLAQSMNNMSNMLDAYENNQKQFFQNVSHELRTPLMSIQGYAEGILEDVLNKNEASQIILSEGLRMENLVKQILYISRLDSGLDTLNISSFNLKNMLFESAERVKILADKNNKEIVLDFPSGDVFIKSDETKLQRAIDNILSNGIRHARNTIKLSYSQKPEDISIVITIEDDGLGILENDLPHIFERFYKGINGNSGLGLAICRDVVEKLGGRVSVENVYSDAEVVGARFVVVLV